jgi:anti-anti-sigma factor
MPDSIEHVEPGKGNMKTGGRTILVPESSITHGTCHEIEEQIKDAIQGSKTEIILDCKHVRLLDSAGLEALVQTHADLQSKGSVLKIVGLNEVCRDILLATRILHMLFVYKDIHEAITKQP